MILSVQAATELGGGMLEQKILEQTAQMDKYSRMVKGIKEDNKEVFREIYSVLDSQQIRQPVRQLCTNTSESKPDFYLRPAPLIFNSSMIEVHRFYN